MLNEYTFANVSFRNIPAEKRVSLRIGGVGITLQQNTWNDLVRLAEDIGIVRPDAESQSDAIGNDGNDDNDTAEDEELQLQATEEEGAIFDNEPYDETATENDENTESAIV
jgi:hypothetical protein